MAKIRIRPWSDRAFGVTYRLSTNAFRERKVTPLRINLDQEDIPTHWYNVVADLAHPPAPPLGPDGNPVPPEAMGAIFPGPILEQEMSAERWIAIPEEVRQIYALWRPAPLCRALRLEQALGTPAKIFYKYEGVSPAGSHKPNSAVPQAYFNKIAGTKRLTPKPAPVSGVRRLPSPVRCLACRCAFSWSRSAISRSHSVVR